MESRKFTDLAGHAWSFLISTPDLKRVKASDVSVDLLDLDGETFTKILQDPATLVDVVAVLLEDQLRRCKPSAVEMERRLMELEADAVARGVALTPEERASVGKPGLSGVEFARRLGGDVLDQASGALLEALIDFFPNRRRKTLRAALDKTNELLDRTADHGLTLIQSGRMDSLIANSLAEMDRQFETLLSTAGNSSTSSPASSGSIPTA